MTPMTNDDNNNKEFDDDNDEDVGGGFSRGCRHLDSCEFFISYLVLFSSYYLTHVGGGWDGWGECMIWYATP
jgi:hypothetical protein